MFPLIDCFLSLVIIALLFWNGYTQTMLRMALQRHAQTPLRKGTHIITRTLPDGAIEYAKLDLEVDGDRVQTGFYRTPEEAMNAPYEHFE